MKTTRKIVSLLLVFAMVVVAGIGVFASENVADGKIIISNPQADTTYKAYKVFSVSYDENNNHSYTATTAVKTLLDGNVSGLSFVENIEGTWTVSQDGSFSPATLAKYIKDNFESFEAALGEGTAFVADGDTVAAANLERGYYFVSSSTGAVCELTNAKTVTIKDKNAVPEIEKTVDAADNSVEVGQVLTYNIKGSVPSTTGYDSYTYDVADTMSEGLTYNEDVKVYIDGTDVTAGEGVTVATDGNGFKVTIDMTKYQTKVDKLVNIEYTATVNDAAIDRNAETNKATLKYSNDPTDGTKTATSEVDVKVYTFNIDIDKYQTGSETTKLAGAKFVLKKDTKYYKYDSTAKKVSWVNTKAEATEITTDENGKAAFEGIAAGTYQIEETEAPEGYNPLPADVSIIITISEDGAATATVNGVASNPSADSLSVASGIANSTGTVLPETGSIGTAVFVVLGSLAVIGAGLFLVTNKRMSKESL